MPALLLRVFQLLLVSLLLLALLLLLASLLYHYSFVGNPVSVEGSPDVACDLDVVALAAVDCKEKE